MTDLRALERASIRAFIESCAPLLGGRVLDVGCGLQPYRDIVAAAGGFYVPHDRAAYPANVSIVDVGPAHDEGGWDAILLTQVLQYVEEPSELLARCHIALEGGGALVVTYPTTWPVVEPEDLWRFTPAGIERLLDRAGFALERNEWRASVSVGRDDLLLGGGAVARA